MDKYNLLFHNCIKIKNYIWFSSISYNGLYRYNMEKKYVERVAEFPNEKFFLETLYSKICRYQNLLIFIPGNANKIAVFDIEKRVFKQINIPYSCDKKKNIALFPDFWEGIVYLDNIYIIGRAKPIILKMNLKSFELKVVYKVCEKLDYCSGEYFGVQATADKNLLYIPCTYQNAILVFDMDREEVSHVKIGEIGNRYFRVVNSNQEFYFIAQNTDCVVVWNKNENVCEEINIKFQKSYGDALICVTKEFVWVLSSGEIYQISKMNHKIYNLINMGERFWIDFVIPYQKGICFVNSITGEWYYIDNKGIVKNLQIQIKEPRSTTEIWRQCKRERVCINESIYMPMEIFLQGFLRGENNDLVKSKTHLSCGDRVWKQL